MSKASELNSLLEARRKGTSKSKDIKDVIDKKELDKAKKVLSKFSKLTVTNRNNHIELFVKSVKGDKTKDISKAILSLGFKVDDRPGFPGGIDDDKVKRQHSFFKATDSNNIAFKAFATYYKAKDETSISVGFTLLGVRSTLKPSF